MNKFDLFPVLIVEDNPVSCKRLEKLLQDEGYDTETACDGVEALEKLQEKFYPIVITDWVMPRMNGLQLVEEIRKRDFSGYVSIMFITAMDSKDDIITGLKAGADDYLTKPFNEAEMIARLNNVKRVLRLERSLKGANEEIFQMTISDPLTMVYNRRYIFDNLPSEIFRSRRYKHPLSLIMCDIDHFKKVNDIYGHKVGDNVLVSFADCLKGSSRLNVDWVSRYGGDEFLLVLPETDVEGAKILADRLRGIVEAQKIHSCKDKDLPVTASFGVSGFDKIPHSDIAVEAFIDQADRMLYAAKNGGRNMVVVSPPLETLDQFKENPK